jgi:hypothetical protein
MSRLIWGSCIAVCASLGAMLFVSGEARGDDPTPTVARMRIRPKVNLTAELPPFKVTVRQTKASAGALTATASCLPTEIRTGGGCQFECDNDCYSGTPGAPQIIHAPLQDSPDGEAGWKCRYAFDGANAGAARMNSRVVTAYAVCAHQ